MYERFALLMQQRGLTAYRVSVDTGISQATLSDWKRGRSVPKAGKLQVLADYFGVSLGYLMGTEEARPFVNVPPTKEQLYTFLFGTPEISEEAAREVMAYARYVAERERREYEEQLAAAAKERETEEAPA